MGVHIMLFGGVSGLPVVALAALGLGSRAQLPWVHWQRHTNRRLFRAAHRNHRKERKGQETNHPNPRLEPSTTSSI